jgi:UDP-N-acetylmuramyl tripeptide synthase
MKQRKWLMIIPAALLVRVIYRLLRLLKLGEGSNLPGKVTLKVFPNVLQSLVPRFRKGWILITGTNGKTTTTKITVALFQEYGYRVVTNARGANLISGILTSVLLAKLYPSQEFMADYAIFEIDEAVLSRSFHLFEPHILVVTNFSRDQLDRYGEVDSNVNKIIELLQKSKQTCKVILNGNDPNIARIGSVVAPKERIFFGIKQDEATQEGSTDFGLLVESETGKGIEADLEPAELDVWAERIQADYMNGSRFTLAAGERVGGSPPVEINLKLPGVFNVLNALAAAGIGSFEIDNDLHKLAKVLSTVEPSYGRSEKFNYRGASVFMFLVKNPVGFNHIIQLLTQDQGNKRILLLLNDLTADGKDVSWIWDVSLENLWKVSGIKEVVSSGTRAGDMGLRVKYSNPPAMPMTVDYSPQRAFRELANRIEPGDDLMILANYTSMITFRPFLLRVCNKKEKHKSKDW